MAEDIPDSLRDKLTKARIAAESQAKLKESNLENGNNNFEFDGNQYYQNGQVNNNHHATVNLARNASIENSQRDYNNNFTSSNNNHTRVPHPRVF